jgi:hypothetical protein
MAAFDNAMDCLSHTLFHWPVFQMRRHARVPVRRGLGCGLSYTKYVLSSDLYCLWRHGECSIYTVLAVQDHDARYHTWANLLYSRYLATVCVGMAEPRQGLGNE